MNKIRILGLLDSSDIYGKERANIEVYHVLQQNGFDVHVGYSKYAVAAMKNELVCFPSKPFPFPRNISGKMRSLKYVFNFIRINLLLPWHIHKLNPDYILFPTEWALFYLYVTLLLTKTKVVFRCGDDPLTYRKRGKVATKIYAYMWKHYVLPRVDILVCNAKYIQKHLRDSGRVDKGYDKLIYNYPPLRLDYFHENETMHLPMRNGLKVGFIGRIVPEKGVLELIEAVGKIKQKGKEITLYIAGDERVNHLYTLQLKNAINQLNLNDDIVYLGKINHINTFYQQCDVICIPSIYEEPMANIVVESKAYHKPCIIFNQGGMPEIVEHKQTGYICDEVSVDALSEGLMFYIDYPSEIVREGEAAFNSINRLQLDKPTFVKKWIDVFQCIK